MLKENTMPENEDTLKEQAQQQQGQKGLRLRIDQRDMETTYANSFRPIASTEELVLDFGVNQAFPVQQKEGEQAPAAEVVFNVSSRIIMNYYTAKRLALSLNQVVSLFEGQFGELKLNADERRVAKDEK